MLFGLGLRLRDDLTSRFQVQVCPTTAIRKSRRNLENYRIKNYRFR